MVRPAFFEDEYRRSQAETAMISGNDVLPWARTNE